MKILYLANIRFPTEMAHGVQVGKACEAFARAGADIELVVPKRWTPIEEDVFAYYGITRRFPVRYLRTPDTVRRFGRFGFLLQIFFFAFAAARYARKQNADIMYGRDEHVLAIALILGVRNIVWESHDGSWNRSARFVARRVRRIVVVSKGQRDFYAERGVAAGKILAVPNGVDTEAFMRSESKEKARARLGLPQGAFIVMYAGALDGWKGTETLLLASTLLPDDVRIVVIGGYEAQVAGLKRNYPGVTFLGQRPYRELPDNLAASDACVLPNTAKDPVSVSFTSPLKLLAYMAAGTPVVASDLPSVRELAGDAVLYVRPDDPQALADGIMRLRGDVSFAAGFADRARKQAGGYDWSVRARRILDFLSSS